MSAPALRTRRTVLERFTSFVDQNGPPPQHDPSLGPCHLWTGSRWRDGYGKFWLDGKSARAPHVALQFVGVTIPVGHEPDHLCKVRACVRPAHLEVVTQHENSIRAGLLRRGRAIGNAAVQAAKTECKRRHPFTPENTRLNRQGKRVCRTCDRDRHRGETT